jgi:hypothetical protein
MSSSFLMRALRTALHCTKKAAIIMLFSHVHLVEGEVMPIRKAPAPVVNQCPYRTAVVFCSLRIPTSDGVRLALIEHHAAECL